MPKDQDVHEDDEGIIVNLTPKREAGESGQEVDLYIDKTE